jgi:hypothetical protein
VPADQPENLASIDIPPRSTRGLVPVVAGLDQFFNLPTDRGKYRPRGHPSVSPVPTSTLMMVPGCIEIGAGLAVPAGFARPGASVVMAWPVAIAATLVSAGCPDLAVRDLVMAVGLFTLGPVAAFRREGWLPSRRTARPAGAYAHVR